MAPLVETTPFVALPTQFKFIDETNVSWCWTRWTAESGAAKEARAKEIKVLYREHDEVRPTTNSRLVQLTLPPMLRPRSLTPWCATNHRRSTQNGTTTANSCKTFSPT
jgi:hypothetical protein